MGSYCAICGNLTRGNNQQICGICKERKRSYYRKKREIEIKNKFFKRLSQYIRFLKEKGAPQEYITELRRLIRPLIPRKKNRK